MIIATPWLDMPVSLLPIACTVRDLTTRLPTTAYIAGGALTRLFSGDVSASDVDVWFASKGAYDYCRDFLHSRPLPGARQEKTDIADESYAVTGGEITTIEVADGAPIQLIGSNFHDPEYQIVRFDFLCCQMALVWRSGRLVFLAEEGAVEDAIAKIARIVNAESPARTGKRVEKYLAKGFTFVGSEKRAA